MVSRFVYGIVAIAVGVGGAACAKDKGTCTIPSTNEQFLDITFGACMERCVLAGLAQNSCPWTASPRITGPSAPE